MKELLNTLLHFIETHTGGLLDHILAHRGMLLAVGTFSALAFVVTLAVLPILLIRLPSTYFLNKKEKPRSGLSLIRRATANAFAILILIAGLLMLVLPGQGLLTLFVGLTLLDFPGKRKAEIALLSRPRIHRAVNSLRRRHGQAPIILPSDTPISGCL